MADQSGQPVASRRAAADLIDAVIDNMRANLEPLRYTTLAPSRYVVYLHPDEFARVEGIVSLLRDETMRALDEELRKLNHTPLYRKYWQRVGGSTPPVQSLAGDWQIEFLPDADGELGPGDILIHSELALPGAADDDTPGAGQRTRRITTVRSGDKTTRRQETVSRPEPATSRTVHARLRYDDNSGPHVFDIVRESTTIGRGGIAYRADVKIEASVDVSREHARIRRDAASGQFFLIDLSTLGTTIDDRPVPRGYDEVDGTKRENGTEAPLADGARIGLAGAVFLRFERV